ncbi:unnamed protein product [Caenorhabditis sp. 36 PRJEB53466]|nr:unnamed protein product [Caenorhabditis sp. 36 PRJEB53466]
MLKSLLSLVTPSKDKKKVAGPAGAPCRPNDISFTSDADASILNDTSVTVPTGEGFGDTSMLCSSRLGDGRKNRTASFDFCLSDKPGKEVVVRRRSLQPTTPTSSASASFLENIFDSSVQQNRLHSVIGDKIYEAPSRSPSPVFNNVSKKL